MQVVYEWEAKDISIDTLHMVKSLNLPTMQPLDPETMKQIFKKQR